MARQAGNVIENKFIKGLITETTVLNFPTDACTETWNCIFDETGLVTRRLGIDFEDGYAETTISETSGYAVTEFLWENAGDTVGYSFLVQQVGETLYFFDVSDNTTPSGAAAVYTIDLNNYVSSNYSSVLYSLPCQYATGKGYLFVANERCQTFYVAYDSVLDTFTATGYNLKYRDFAGVDDGLDIDERPTASVSGLKTSNPEHYYNLLNQGWFRQNNSGTVLDSWDSARTYLPSNSDVVGYFRVSVSNTFDSSLINEHYAGNSPAPKGHFILTVGLDERNDAMAAEGFTGATLASSFSAAIDPTGLTNIGDFTNPDNAFDDDTATAATRSSTTSGYIGKDLGSASTISNFVFNMLAGGTITVTADLYGNSSSPASGTDGTLLGSKTFGVGTSLNTIARVDNHYHPTSTYRYVWVNLTWSPSATLSLYELDMFTALDAADTFAKSIVFSAGRVFYAGFKDSSIASNIYFSQVIEDDAQFGKCYQLNDPASDELSDLLATDGGVIKIPDIGAIQKLYAFQGQIIVYATNGVWLVKGGGTNQPFSATGYSVSKISSIGCRSPYSVVDVKGLPVWWAEDGIYTVSYDANYDSTTLQSLSETTIKTFLLDIPAKNREYIKGTYDRLEDVIHWVFSDDASIVAADYWTYNKALCMNVKSRAFYPWVFTESSENPQRIQGCVYVQGADRLTTPGVKYPITRSSSTKLSYAECWQTSYKEWEDYATLTTDAGDEEDFSSYFKAGYRLDTEGAKFLQGNYIYTFMPKETDASLYVQGQYQFSSSGNSGRWSTAQQAYNSKTTLGRSYMDTKVSRVKLRGEGQALQLYYYSETGKPFSCIGWNLFISSNAGI